MVSSAVPCIDQLPNLVGASAVVRAAAEQCTASHASVYWPSDPSRGRAYIHLQDDEGLFVGFVKWVSRTDAEALNRESHALCAFGSRTMPNWWRSPALLSAGVSSDGSHSWVLMEALPQALRPVRIGTPPPQPILDELAADSRFVRVDELPALSWWGDLQDGLVSAPELFKADLAAALRSGLWVARVHGDFGPHNLGYSRGHAWVFDWESSSGDAPLATDFWGFALSSQPDDTVLRWAFSGSTRHKAGFLTALAHRVAMNVGNARLLVADWDAIKERYDG